MSTKAKQMNNQSFENSVPSFGFGGKTVIRPLPSSRSAATAQPLTTEEIRAKILKLDQSTAEKKEKEKKG